MRNVPFFHLKIKQIQNKIYGFRDRGQVSQKPPAPAANKIVAILRIPPTHDKQKKNDLSVFKIVFAVVASWIIRCHMTLMINLDKKYCTLTHTHPIDECLDNSYRRISICCARIIFQII